LTFCATVLTALAKSPVPTPAALPMVAVELEAGLAFVGGPATHEASTTAMSRAGRERTRAIRAADVPRQASNER
jgi:hypothetical protein